MSCHEAILAQFGLDASEFSLQSLGNHGGMSGAQLWRLTPQTGSVQQAKCLRRWPTLGPSAERLAWIHQLQIVARQSGCEFVPLPHSIARATNERAIRGSAGTPSRDTWLSIDESLWELTDWMPGTADFFDTPTDARLVAAVRAIAEFHRAVDAVETLNPNQPELATSTVSNPRPVARRLSVAPCVEVRCRMLEMLSASEHQRIASAIDGRYGERVAELAVRIVQRIPERVDADLRLLQACRFPVRLQPCIGDVWHDHLLFTGDTVTGLVDFGAARIDTVTSDLARLLGSLVPDCPERWQVALENYREVMDLESHELSLLAAIDRVNPLLSGVNWVRWLFVDGRRFEDVSGIVAGRMEQIGRRLDQAAATR